VASPKTNLFARIRRSAVAKRLSVPLDAGTSRHRAPEGRRVYAVGDIHGRLDLLERLHRMILEDSRAAPSSARRVIVYLGDYVDRGPDSRAVVDLLAKGAMPEFERVHLLGNHEWAMLEFLENRQIAEAWFAYGGYATLVSYGINPMPRPVPPEGRIPGLQNALKANLPAAHFAFLSSLKLSHVEGDYLFVHAGIRPGVPLNRQLAEDLTQIRYEFLDSKADHGKMVVHGHTITDEPQVLENRIGIDTGAFASDRLTCLVIEGASRAFLST
jgi:calcineurin-like phosphoesterase family protein